MRKAIAYAVPYKPPPSTGQSIWLVVQITLPGARVNRNDGVLPPGRCDWIDCLLPRKDNDPQRIGMRADNGSSDATIQLTGRRDVFGDVKV